MYIDDKFYCGHWPSVDLIKRDGGISMIWTGMRKDKKSAVWQSLLVGQQLFGRGLELCPCLQEHSFLWEMFRIVFDGLCMSIVSRILRWENIFVIMCGIRWKLMCVIYLTIIWLSSGGRWAFHLWWLKTNEEVPSGCLSLYTLKSAWEIHFHESTSQDRTSALR